MTRRLLQIVADIGNLGGRLAVQKLKLFLCIDVEQESFVCDVLIKHDFFGLQRGNVVILPMPRFSGMCYDEVRSGNQKGFVFLSRKLVK